MKRLWQRILCVAARLMLASAGAHACYADEVENGKAKIIWGDPGKYKTYDFETCRNGPRNVRIHLACKVSKVFPGFRAIPDDISFHQDGTQGRFGIELPLPERWHGTIKGKSAPPYFVSFQLDKDVKVRYYKVRFRCSLPNQG